MNILHINQSDILGGAALAGHRLHMGLKALGHTSTQLVAFPKTGAPDIERIPRKRWIERLGGFVSDFMGLTTLEFIGAGPAVARHRFYRDADVLNFHNIGQAFCTYAALPRLTREKPGVLTVHDMWVFTGHCCYATGCDRWQHGCGNCPDTGAFLPVNRDGSSLEMRLKKWAYDRSDLTVVSPSRYFEGKLKKSILGTKDIRFIPNGIDVDLYQPRDKELSRAMLGITPRNKVLLFASQHVGEERKGFDLLVKAVSALPHSLRKEISVVALGDAAATVTKLLDGMVNQVICPGYVGGDRLKSMIFSAADLFVLPTRDDNQPLVLLECMACGVPMACFAVGGVVEMVRPDQTGFLAKPFDTQELAQGMEAILTDPAGHALMAATCRQVAVSEYSLTLQSERYAALFHEKTEA